MALKIESYCINCGECELACPYGAIYPGGVNWRKINNKFFRFCDDINHYDKFYSKTHYYIVPEKCTECLDVFSEPACLSVCPLAGCVPDPEHIEDQHELQSKHMLLTINGWRY